ncbi:MAG TPA: VCBS repeat-containing protein, partial [Phototrophicaceae bacterium]|nr:VCBS repeat-containing protein [Phototrophicaceae bacterium]
MMLPLIISQPGFAKSEVIPCPVITRIAPPFLPKTDNVAAYDHLIEAYLNTGINSQFLTLTLLDRKLIPHRIQWGAALDIQIFAYQPVHTADINGDGYLDILVNMETGVDSKTIPVAYLWVYLCSGSRYELMDTLTTEVYWYSAGLLLNQIVDLTGDGIPELLISTFEQGVESSTIDLSIWQWDATLQKLNLPAKFYIDDYQVTFTTDELPSLEFKNYIFDTDLFQ